MKTEETTSTSNTTIYDVLVEVESPNIYIQTNYRQDYNIKQPRRIYKKNLLNNCTSACLMVNELKERFSETGIARQFEIETKIKKFEIENDDF
ncbi:hypothetical protein H8356DRAFT_1361552 [Neocallimastix lanati (nom. inval.)]|nr:hypothetical protein H8356DRAFT_1361552 [Neocallimastix sp. JGI-2020a]